MISHLVSLLPSPSLSPPSLISAWQLVATAATESTLWRCERLFLSLAVPLCMNAHVQLFLCCNMRKHAHLKAYTWGAPVYIHTHTHTPAVALKPAFGSHTGALLASLHAVSLNRSWILHLEIVLVTHTHTNTLLWIAKHLDVTTSIYWTYRRCGIVQPSCQREIRGEECLLFYVSTSIPHYVCIVISLSPSYCSLCFLHHDSLLSLSPA